MKNFDFHAGGDKSRVSWQLPDPLDLASFKLARYNHSRGDAGMATNKTNYVGNSTQGTRNQFYSVNRSGQIQPERQMQSLIQLSDRNKYFEIRNNSATQSLRVKKIGSPMKDHSWRTDNKRNTKKDNKRNTEASLLTLRISRWWSGNVAVCATVDPTTSKVVHAVKVSIKVNREYNFILFIVIFINFI